MNRIVQRFTLIRICKFNTIGLTLIADFMEEKENDLVSTMSIACRLFYMLLKQILILLYELFSSPQLHSNQFPAKYLRRVSI